jgi:hypothetical protein
MLWTLTTGVVGAYWGSPDPHRGAARGRNRIKYRIPIAASILRINGMWQAITDPTPAQVAASDRYYSGGRVHPISAADAGELIAAGFADYVVGV